MKNLSKLSTLILIAIFSLTACTKKDDGSNKQDTALDVTAKKVMDNMHTTMSQISQPDAQSLDRNLVQNFGFTFMYPITLTYNNDVTVTVNSSSQLLDIVNGITETSYIKAINYPFNIDDQTASRSSSSINSEADLRTTIDSHDSDGDGVPNYADTDDDNDSVADNQEDVNNDGDVTNDDSDNDGVANVNDTDDDGDGVPTADETYGSSNDVSNTDSDNDGTPNYLDTDSDNDGVSDGQDNDANGDGNVDDNGGNDDNNGGNDNNGGGNDDNGGNDNDNDGGN